MTDTAAIEPGGAGYWDERYARIGSRNVSWFQDYPSPSMRLIRAQGFDPRDPVVDVGGGASTLVDALVAEGFGDITVVDVSGRALADAAARVPDAVVEWVCSDVRTWRPDRSYALWHDRAAYHFLTDPADQQRYWRAVREHLAPGGRVIIATFAEDGPDMCSGLPVQRYSAEQLAATMGEGFRLVDSHREEHTTPGGATQRFVWVVAERI